MTYADLAPEKVDVMQAIPPPANYKLPKAIKSKMTEDQRKIAESKFIHKAANSYYAEWFWFPYHPQVFVNCWYELKPGGGFFFLCCLLESANDGINI